MSAVPRAMDRDEPRARRRDPRRFAAAVAGGTSLVGLAMALAIAWVGADGWRAALELGLARGTGWCAAGALLASLAATPVTRLARARVAAHGPALRRAFGISAASLALVHAALSSFGHLGGAWDVVWSWPGLRAGALALLVLLPLLLTSFPALLRRLRVRLWKPLHRLVYAAAVLLALHVWASPFAPRWLALAVVGFVAVALLARLLPRR